MELVVEVVRFFGTSGRFNSNESWAMTLALVGLTNKDQRVKLIIQNKVNLSTELLGTDTLAARQHERCK